MPRRTDLQTILILGSGPIVIGQASEFDYAGTQAVKALDAIAFSLILRASFTLGGAGSGIAHNAGQLTKLLRVDLSASPVGSVLVEESVPGWKEYELEVIRDAAGNGIIVCSIENFDAMGAHTAASVTVAPAQTLTDREYRRLRDDALKVLDAVGVVTGGSNVQVAVDPESGRVIVIEMNPRVSRSSALASKATGYPIAKIAALLAVGYTLPELPNDITDTSSACFEPSLDYTVVKIPRWAFEKFPGTPDSLGTTMQSVGEVMAIGRTFREAFQKALRSLELNLDGWESTATGRSRVQLQAALESPNQGRLTDLHETFRRGLTPE